MNLFENLQMMYESENFNLEDLLDAVKEEADSINYSNAEENITMCKEELEAMSEGGNDPYVDSVCEYVMQNHNISEEVIDKYRDEIEKCLIAHAKNSLENFEFYFSGYLDENLQAMHESKEVKTFNISFKKDGVYQANLVNGYNEEQVTEFYANYKPDAEIIGVKLATNDDMKPGKPVIDSTKEAVKEADKITDDPDSEKEVKPAELRTMSGTDIYAWQGANDFRDGSKPLIADGEYGTMIVSGSDSSNRYEATIGIYFGDENEHWATSEFINKEKAIKYAKMLLPLLDEEIDDYDLKRFGFEIIA